MNGLCKAIAKVELESRALTSIHQTGSTYLFLWSRTPLSWRKVTAPENNLQCKFYLNLASVRWEEPADLVTDYRGSPTRLVVFSKNSFLRLLWSMMLACSQFFCCCKLVTFTDPCSTMPFINDGIITRFTFHWEEYKNFYKSLTASQAQMKYIRVTRCFVGNRRPSSISRSCCSLWFPILYPGASREMSSNS